MMSMKDQFEFNKEIMKVCFDIELKSYCPKMENDLTMTIKCFFFFLNLRFLNTNSFDATFSSAL